MRKYLRECFIKKNPLWMALLLFILAFLLRLYIVFKAQVIANDGILYIKMAKIVDINNLQKISEFSFFNLYPVLVALAQPILGDWELSGRMVSAILGALAIIPLFLIIKKMVNAKVGIIASFFYIISPHFVEYSSDVLRESSFWFFSITALWLAWEGITRKRWLLFFLSSISAGLAIFTRIEGVAIILITTLWIFLYLPKSNAGLKKACLFTLIFVFSFPIITSPFLFFLKSKVGRWELAQAGGYFKSLPYLYHGTEKTLEVEPAFLNKTSLEFRALIELSKRHKYMIYFSEIIYKFIKSFNIFLFLLLLFGIFKRRAVPYSKNEFYILIWFSTFFSISFLYMTRRYYFSTRHGLLMGIPALVWAGIGFYEFKNKVERWMSKTEFFPTVYKFATVFLVFIIIVLILPKTLSSYRSDKIGLKRMGIYLKELGYSKSKFVGQPELTRMAFYADSDYVVLPPGRSFEETMEFMRENQVSLLLIDGRTIQSYSKDLMDGLSRLNLEKVPIPPSGKEEKSSIVLYQIQ
jgi:4-amino-4-deoxy-L-arabinose transferase-like glycosyltransferase